MSANVLAKAGDSNFVALDVIYGLGCREPAWGEHAALEPVLRRYRATILPPGRPSGPSELCVPGNSFSRVSAATMSGIPTLQLTEPLAGDEGLTECLPGETMLSCEVRVVHPRWVFVNVGTNDVAFGYSPARVGKRMAELIDEIERLGPVPVILTIPPQSGEAGDGRFDWARRANEAIVEAAERDEVPVLDQWRAFTRPGMADFGLIAGEGIHLETLGGSRTPGALQRSVDFGPEGLRYGNNLRNLLLLQTLERLDLALLGRAPEP